MSTTNEQGLRSDRVRYPLGVDLDEFRCSICHNILWKPVACQSCENPFCSACIAKRFETYPGQCPMQCDLYTERSCPPFIIRQLAKLQVDCIYQSHGCKEVVLYNGIEKHEAQCGYQPQQCAGCRRQISKKDLSEHEAQCPLIELTCADCKLVYKQRDASTLHTDAQCFSKQLKQLRHESEESKRQLTATQELLFPEKITFADIPNASMEPAALLTIYRSLKWNNINYVHERYTKEKYAGSGYVTAFTPGGSSYVAFSNSSSSISVENEEEVFDVLSLWACAAWNDELQLTITGHRKSVQIHKQTSTLLRGKPCLIQLCWTDIDILKFEPSQKSNFILSCLTVSYPHRD